MTVPPTPSVPSTPLPPLTGDVGPTRDTLHAYARAVGAIPRVHGIAHPKWWHISLLVRPEGLVTTPIPLPDGRSISFHMDLRSHQIVVETSTGSGPAFPMHVGTTPSAMGDQLIAAAADAGLEGEYDRSRFAGDEELPYDPEAAVSLFAALVAVDQVLREHHASIPGATGPVQLWPHGFDLAFEWFGTRTVTAEEDGVVTAHPSQINLGFATAPEPYFYSNPWPFASELLDHPLPEGARWHTEGWQGSVLPYDAVAGDPEGRSRVLRYARAVFDLAAPALTA